jgi:hypothetical protein
MSLTRLRARVADAERSLDAHAAATRLHGSRLRARLDAAWPWLWVGGGAVLGVITEQRSAAPAARSTPADNSNAPAPQPSVFASLPWGLLLALLDRAMVLAERDAASARQSPEQKAEDSASVQPESGAG